MVWVEEAERKAVQIVERDWDVVDGTVQLGLMVNWKVGH